MEPPIVRFELNKDLDIWVAHEFKQATPDEVVALYGAHGSELREFVMRAQRDWDKVSRRYFEIVATLFKGHSWPKGEYVGYASVFNCNPRFLNGKTFQAYYKHRVGSNFVAAHELLHFIFYDYAVNKFPDLFEGKNTESGIFWDVAEVFNVVVLFTPQFSFMFDVTKPIFYPEHEFALKILNEFFNEHQNVDALVPEIYRLLRQSR